MMMSSVCRSLRGRAAWKAGVTLAKICSVASFRSNLAAIGITTTIATCLNAESTLGAVRDSTRVDCCVVVASELRE